jgi:anti-anti-sigma regulatory factor
MQHSHVLSLPHGGITVITVAKDTLAAINEGTCWSGPTPVVAELIDEFVQALGAAPGPVVVDIRDTQYIDHASVDVLFRLAKLVASHTGSGFICCSSEVKAILVDLLQLNKVCPTATNLNEIMKELAGRQTGQV